MAAQLSIQQLSMQQQNATSQFGGGSLYLESLYEQFLEAPDSVEPSWRAYFSSIAEGEPEANHSLIRAALVEYAKHPTALATPSVSSAQGRKLAAVEALVQAYRFFGHFQAQTDPLKLQQHPQHDELQLAHHGLSKQDLQASFTLQDFDADGSAHALQDIVAKLQATYCGSIGFEFMQVATTEERDWLRERIETPRPVLTAEKQHWLLTQLVAADGLEKYLGQRFVGQKRFSLEGNDSLIPMVNHLVNRGGELGLKEVVVGMAHRGRLNVLANVMGKSPENLFAEFEGKYNTKLLSGDVGYHNGFSSDIKTQGGMVHLTLAFNPAHLEIVSPVVEGSVRARQERRQAKGSSQVMAIQMHGDSAFCGQGVVMETFSRSQTPGYSTAGSVHIVINNQIGFTTSLREETRSSYYATDVAKMVNAPIFHVNSHDPEAVLFIAELALAYRTTFHKDVVIDLVGYRRHGHNEADEPAATQPLMYQVIKKTAVMAQHYADKLVQQSKVAADFYSDLVKQYKAKLEKGKPVTRLIDKRKNSKFIVDWTPYYDVSWDTAYESKIAQAELVKLAETLASLPADFTLQKQVAKVQEDRAKMTRGELPLNWGYAETLAYATLLKAGHFVRITGEDCQRGTFSHRHAVLHDQKNAKMYTPLQHIDPQQGRFQVINSILSEEAIMAFEYGYANSSPDGLVVWEAQFGDFANGAQVVIDQFITSAEEKWGRLSGLTLFLPHGYEGMGPEHSSARLGRYLQLCAHDNIQVCVPTTPAQIYHLIRRQVLRPLRKPLIVMTPKSLLRHPLAVSTLDELANGHYQLVIDEVDKLNAAKVKRVIFCQGKVYYDILKKRREQKIDDIAIIRMEQLYPFPEARMQEVMAQYAQVNDIIWCQEEPRNQSAWFWVQHDIRRILTDKQTLNYAGRKQFASPAVGYSALHLEQQVALVNDALGLK